MFHFILAVPTPSFSLSPAFESGHLDTSTLVMKKALLPYLDKISYIDEQIAWREAEAQRQYAELVKSNSSHKCESKGPARSAVQAVPARRKANPRRTHAAGCPSPPSPTLTTRPSPVDSDNADNADDAAAAADDDN